MSHKDIVRDIDFHHSGEKLASVSWDGTIKVWDTSSFKLIYTITVPHVKMYSVCFYNDRLISGDENGQIVIWNEKKQQAQLSGHSLGVNNVDCHNGFIVSSSALPLHRAIALFNCGDNIKLLSKNTLAPCIALHLVQVVVGWLRHLLIKV